MSGKISVYVSEEQHRIFKAVASQRGQSLSEFMVSSALNSLYTQDRRSASQKMDRVRESTPGSVSTEELLDMRKEGRRY